ncbi:hypothetical protein CWC46_08485 [Prodigiosinella confusarubida]|uniref:Uncharacterized protein n=1 Tax=Serratia sp. (strain ATCC 39006) TaxID=104623 RepID=A0A2I5THW9_SERS3|nr:hypothetical protein CWC46_08485 [Serratia sp. ATCC 39006]AUH04162.1 hypothetical protein Ser39006_008490 [Serratia sp. ATCC 39006]
MVTVDNQKKRKDLVNKPRPRGKGKHCSHYIQKKPALIPSVLVNLAKRMETSTIIYLINKKINHHLLSLLAAL